MGLLLAFTRKHRKYRDLVGHTDGVIVRKLIIRIFDQITTMFSSTATLFT